MVKLKVGSGSSPESHGIDLLSFVIEASIEGCFRVCGWPSRLGT